MVSILEYDKEWEEKKLRKAEYEAGKSDGIEIGKSEGIKIGREETLAEMIYNMEAAWLFHRENGRYNRKICQTNRTIFTV